MSCAEPAECDARDPSFAPMLRVANGTPAAKIESKNQQKKKRLNSTNNSTCYLLSLKFTER